MNNMQTIKNMELVLLEIRKHTMTKGSDTRVPKTLIHSYLTMLKDVVNPNKEESDKILLQSSQLYIITRYIKEDKMQELFKDHDYVGINNYATVIDKANQAIDSIGITPLSMHHSSLSLIEDLLDSSIKTGTLVTFFDETHRGMGKTTALIKKAKELNALLIVSHKSMVALVDKAAKEMGIIISVASFSQISLHQYLIKAQESGYLVDELVTTEQIKLLNSKGCKLLGGFTRILV